MRLVPATFVRCSSSNTTVCWVLFWIGGSATWSSHWLIECVWNVDVSTNKATTINEWIAKINCDVSTTISKHTHTIIKKHTHTHTHTHNDDDYHHHNDTTKKERKKKKKTKKKSITNIKFYACVNIVCKHSFTHNHGDHSPTRTLSPDQTQRSHWCRVRHISTL